MSSLQEEFDRKRWRSVGDAELERKALGHHMPVVRNSALRELKRRRRCRAVTKEELDYALGVTFRGDGQDVRGEDVLDILFPR